LQKLLIKLSNSKSSIAHTDSRPGEVKKLNSNVEKIKNYGHINKCSLEEGLQKYVNWVAKYDLDSLGIMK